MKTVLDMSFASDLIMVNVGLWSRTNNDYGYMLITVDTGASVTTISTDLLHNLGYAVSTGKQKRIITASSVEYVRSVTIDRLRIGGIELKDIEVYAHTFPESSFSMGVLGLNVLSKFDVSFLFSRNEVEFTHR
jgi:clan AA aspartic protease (TIGR02281 family)